MSDFIVKGRLDLDAKPFEAGVDQAEAAVQGLSAAQDRLNTSNTGVATASAKQTQAVASTAVAQNEAARATDAASRAQQQNRVVVDQSARSLRELVANLNTQQKANLGFQLNDIFTQLASGQGLMRTAVQQGPQITQVFGGVGNILRAIPGVAMAAAAALAIVGTTIVAGFSSAAAAETRQRQFNIELQATGNIAATTARQLDSLVRSEAQRPGAGRADTAAALSQFLTNANLDTETALGRALAVSRDFARVTGQELPAAAGILNQVLDGSSASVRKLDQAYNILTPRELEQIRLLETQGRRQEATAITLEALERRFKSLNEQGVSASSKGLNELGNAWSNFADRVGNSEIVQALLKNTAKFLSGAAQAIDAAGGKGTAGNGGPTLEEVQGLRQQVADAKAELAQLKSIDINKVIDPSKLQSQIAQQEKRVRDAEANLKYVEGRLVSDTVSAGDRRTQAEISEADRSAKEVQDLIARSKTIEAQKRDLQAEKDRISTAIKQGVLPSESLKEGQERLRQIDGQLAGLSTTSQKLQRDLDIESKLAKLPPHLAAIERAGIVAERAAREAGDTQDEVNRKVAQARDNAAQQQRTATEQQISLLSAEAQGALTVADAYNRSRDAGIRAAAQQAAIAAQEAGQIAPGTGAAFAQQTLEKNAATAVATAAEKNRAYAEELDGLQRLVAAEGVSAEAAREAERVNRVAALAIQLRAQAEASGSQAIATAAEKQIAEYDRLSQRQLTIDRTRAGNQLNAQFDPNVSYRQRMAQLATLRASGVLTERTIAEANKQYELEKLEASRETTDGMRAGLSRYADEATNAGRAAADGVKQGFQTMEDALVQFVVSGQINFSNLANSIIADLARIAIRQNITGPLASGLSSVLKDIFGGGDGPTSAPVDNVGFTSEHTGGMVGEGAITHFLPPSVFAGARRYHSGGMVLGANEVPIIAKKGEMVLTEEQQRARGGAPRVSVNVINNGQPANVRQGGMRSDGAGGFSMDIILDAVEDGLARRLDNGTGKVAGVLQSRYGARRVGRR